jgi:hypothetical protein
MNVSDRAAPEGLTPERRAEIEADVMAIVRRHGGPTHRMGIPLTAKPKVVARDGEPVRDADVRVSPADPKRSSDNS